LTQQAVRLGPATAVFYENLTNYTVALQRFDETRQIIRETQARQLDHLEFHMTLCALASPGEDSDTCDFPLTVPAALVAASVASC
jgi:hypothetical protein